MKSLLRLLVPGLVLLLQGCSEFRFSKYSGPDMVWPTGTANMADDHYAVPVYRGWPTKPYSVMGTLKFPSPDTDWNEGDTKAAARRAKSLGADAVIMRFGTEAGVGSLAGAAQDSVISAFPDQTSLLLIKWKSTSELAALAGRIGSLKAAATTNRPEFKEKPQVVDMAIEYIRTRDPELASPDCHSMLDAILAKLGAQGLGKASRWLFKGTVRTATLMSTQTLRVFGVGEFMQDGTSATLTSVEGTDLNFSGTIQGGRLAGQLGFAMGSTIASAKAEGVLVGDRISLTSQGHTPEGGFQASFQLLR